MAASGSGTGTPITVPTGIGSGPAVLLPSKLPNCAVTLADYAAIIGYDEPAFFGVTYDGQELTDCSKLWQERDRLALATALAEAQTMMEKVLNYPLCPKWFTEEKSVFGYQVTTRWGKLLAAGKRAEDDVSLGETVSYMSEPAIIGPIPVTFTDINEVKVYLPNSEREVQPSSISIAGGNLTIEIPRARLVALDQPDWVNTWLGYRFIDLFNFTDTVDIKRVYNDPTVSASLTSRTCNCSRTETEGCISILHEGVGIIDLRSTGLLCGHVVRANVYYQAGLTVLDDEIRSALVRLAHTLMPEEDCKYCDRMHRLWERDTNVPAVVTRERINCPFGQSDGAWFAYKVAQSNRLVRIYAL